MLLLRAAPLFALAWIAPNAPQLAICHGTNVAKAACESGVTKCCAEAAAEAQEGRNACASASEAFRLLKVGCDGGDGESCNELSKAVALTADASGSRRLAARAIALWASACDQGDADGCTSQAEAIESKTPRLAKRRVARAREILERKCQEKDEMACLRVAVWNLRDGKDIESALRHVERACSAALILEKEGVGSCEFAAHLDSAIFSDQQQSRIEHMLELGCGRGEASACARLAHRSRGRKDPDATLRWATAACRAGMWQWCETASDILKTTDPVAARALSQQGETLRATMRSAVPKGCPSPQ